MNLLQKYRAELILEREGQSKLFSSVLRIGDKIFWFFSGLAASAVMFGFYVEELTPNSNYGTGGWVVYISIIAAILLVVIGGVARATLNLFFSDRRKSNG